ncbi:MAG TPA: efflux transporter outer membrane subunit [Burkholderiales bacterium]|jgi:multidrug efflux system outer membrane protein
MKTALLLTSVVFLGGCITVGPDYQRPGFELPKDYPVADAAAEAAPVAEEWWKLYSDATLDDLVAASRTNNADMRLAIARVSEAAGLVREANAAYYPEVTGSATASRTRVSNLTIPPPQPGIPVARNQYQLSASTSFELDFWGKYARTSEAARANLASTQLSRDVVDLTLAGSTAQAYFALRSLDAQILVLDTSILARRDSLEIAKARLDSGLASELDVYQAQGALSDALVQKRDAERTRALTERLLAVLTGRLDLKLAPGDLFSLPVPPTPPAGLPSTLLERRPDIRSAEETLHAVNAQIGVARAALFPSISLTALLGVQSAELGNLIARNGGVWSVGAGVAGPIFDAGRRQARVEQTQARREQALAGYQRSIETAFREVSDALVNVGESAATEEELWVRLQAARNALDLSNVRYESGYSPYLEVLDAQRTANDAELAFVRNRQARLAFTVDLMKALGGGWKN